MSEVIQAEVENGVVVSFSDAHFWPGVENCAHRALVFLLPSLDPEIVVANGDILDGARISKHARIGWHHAPRLKDEIDTCKQNMNAIYLASEDAQHVWTLGNHDARFETYLANHAPEYNGVKGFSLKEHFPVWQPCWRLDVNENTIFKHRWNGGSTATKKNVIEAGCNIVTGHLHSPRVSPYTDYTGTRYGVDDGMLADPAGPQFVAYTEKNPLDWQGGFAVLTFRDYQLLPPELVIVLNDHQVAFRGEVLDV